MLYPAAAETTERSYAVGTFERRFASPEVGQQFGRQGLISVDRQNEVMGSLSDSVVSRLRVPLPLSDEHPSAAFPTEVCGRVGAFGIYHHYLVDEVP